MAAGWRRNGGGGPGGGDGADLVKDYLRTAFDSPFLCRCKLILHRWQLCTVAGAGRDAGGGQADGEPGGRVGGAIPPYRPDGQGR